MCVFLLCCKLTYNHQVCNTYVTDSDGTQLPQTTQTRYSHFELNTKVGNRGCLVFRKQNQINRQQCFVVWKWLLPYDVHIVLGNTASIREYQMYMPSAVKAMLFKLLIIRRQTQCTTNNWRQIIHVLTQYQTEQTNKLHTDTALLAFP